MAIIATGSGIRSVCGNGAIVSLLANPLYVLFIAGHRSQSARTDWTLIIFLSSSDVIDSGPGVVTHRRSFYACVLFKINAQRGTTERDEMMMFSFDSFVYNNTRKKRGEKTHTRTNTEKTNRSSVFSKSLEWFFRNEDRNSERVHACVHARPMRSFQKLV